MTNINLEHINITVEDPVQTAELLCDLFDWKLRWQGDAINGGYSVHVGSEESYLALYNSGKPQAAAGNTYSRNTGLNHIGIVVDNLETIQKKIEEAGFELYNFGDYEPGRRFYFNTSDGLEIEVVSYR